ncbi:MAG: KDO2-lipid IV(A) lauroyltransferase [Bradymonadia bacterium]|jgi:KDO2-lipid IV(A) lauroyltransferase
MRGLIWLAGRAPPRVVDAIGVLLGALWHAVVPIRRRIARDNLQRALGTTPRATRRLVRLAYRHYGRALAEALRSAGGRPPPIEVRGEATLRAALAEGRGVLVLSAHLGNFEALVRAAGRFDVPVHVITKRFSGRASQRGWQRIRHDGPSFFGAGSARAIHAALARGEIVADVLDQHAPPGRAVWVPFFGRVAATMPDLVRLAHQSGAPIVPLFTRRSAGRHIVTVHAPIELTGALVEDVARCVAQVEAAIQAQPTQWLWIHRRWKPIPADIQAALVDGRAGLRRVIRASARAASSPLDDRDHARAPGSIEPSRPGSLPAAPSPPPS